MAYLLIEDFKFGMDRRRERVSGIPGTLWTGKNIHITRGGDIKRVKKFASRFALPAGSHGLAVAGEQIFVFDETDLSGSMPAGVRFQRLQAPGAAAMARILDAKSFQGSMYAIAEYVDGNVHHFYDGTRVTTWDTVADNIASFEITAQYLAAKVSEDSAVSADYNDATIIITALIPGTAFTAAKATVDNGGTNDQDITLTTVQANVAAVAEVRATGTVQVTGGTSFPGTNKIEDVTVDGVSLFANPVNWISSNDGTASAIVTEINNNTAAHGFTAISAGDTVTITAAAGTGVAPNGDVVAADIPGISDVTVATGNMSGGVDEVEAVAQVVTAELIGTLETTDQFTITINGTDYNVTPRGAATGRSLYIHKNRVYSTVSSIVRYCVINDPTDWATTTTGADAGFINISGDSEGAEILVGMADYNGVTAIFSQGNVYIYSLSADNSLNSIVSVLENTGTRARHSIAGFGNRDVFYLDQSGVRSIQARDSSGDAAVDDVGTVIDPFVQEHADSIDESDLVRAVAAVEPKDNMFMLLVGSKVFILSRYPNVKISAWSYMEPDTAFTHLARTPRRLYARDTDTIYLYGGISGSEYDDAVTNVPVVETPFVSAEDEAGIKMLTGFDMACTGVWEVKALTDPNHPTQETDAGTFRQTTYHMPHCGLPGRTSHVAFKLTGKSAGAAGVSSLALHFEREERR